METKRTVTQLWLPSRQLLIQLQGEFWKKVITKGQDDQEIESKERGIEQDVITPRQRKEVIQEEVAMQQQEFV